MDKPRRRLLVNPVQPTGDFVSRGGLKLQAMIDCLQLDLTGMIVADLGSNVGGFVDCLLQRGVIRVYAVDTGYGVLAWKLRKDPRVVVMERHNALHAELPEPVDLVTIDVGWTRQDKILPVAAKLLKTGGRIISLIKPHYESDQAKIQGGVLSRDQALEILDKVADRIEALGFSIEVLLESPLVGQGGNVEFLACLKKSIM
jgi:23S rRNA (cytidine1920-2'-O)/16S rRNA (cytidine1409-2'-O)-methyltransferase